ncbi:hypothetical protein ACG7TL_003598 [Trametes sanguinea]
MASPHSSLGDPAVFKSLQEIIAVQKEKGWDEAWKAEVTPWDAKAIQPALKELVETEAVNLPRSGRAFVPGCGRGYDAVYIASSLGLDTLGADISPTAIKAAEEYKDTVGGPGNVKFEVCDFFAVEEEAAFELIYDYTFFVAIPPSMRQAWGKQISRLVKPGGYLITLIFPILPYTDAGPPFYVRSEHYEAILGHEWEKILDTIPKKTLESHVGKERMLVWKKL